MGGGGGDSIGLRSSKQLGGVAQGGGGRQKKRPDPGLLVPDASRQEAEANSFSNPSCEWCLQMGGGG